MPGKEEVAETQSMLRIVANMFHVVRLYNAAERKIKYFSDIEMVLKHTLEAIAHRPYDSQVPKPHQKPEKQY